MNKYFGIKKINNINLITLLFSELSIEDAEDFKKGLSGLISGEENQFIINAKKCDFLPSIVLSVLIDFCKEVKTKNGKTVFCSFTEKVKTIFKITKLEKAVEIYKTEEEAIKSFS